MFIYSSPKNKVKFLNIYIDNISSKNLLNNLKDGGVVFTPNIDHLMKIQKNEEFYRAYQKADYVVCDSQILFFISRLLGEKITEKISGSDLFPQFYHHYRHDREIKIFLLGGTDEVAAKAQQKINQKVGREIIVAAHSPSIGFEKDEVECQKIIELINQSEATVLAVGVGAPKQEIWIDKYRNKLKKVKIFLAIGATIDFEAERVKRAPLWMSRAGLEWLHRLLQDPQRLWKRYLLDSLPFFWLILLQKLNLYRFSPAEIMESELNNIQGIERDLAKATQTNVLMFGPSLTENGGMGAVQKHILDRVPDRYNLEHLAIWDGKQNTLALFSQAIRGFLFKLIKNEVDLVHLHVSEGGSVLRNGILAVLAFVFNKPVVMHAHGCEFHLFYDSLSPTAQRLVNWMWQRCAATIVLSESWRQLYIRKCCLNSDRVIVRYNPVVVTKNTELPNRQNCDRPLFAFLGKIAERKGIFDFLEAIAQTDSETRAKIDSTIAGNGEIDRATALAEQLDIANAIDFPGWIDAEERDRLLRQADIFVLPSYNEGLPMALLEAMGWGLPVIVTPVGGIPEVIIDRQTGLLVEPGDIEGLTAAIETLVNDEALRLKLGKAAYQKALDLDVNNYIKDLFDLYGAILLENKTNRSFKIKNYP